MGKKKPGCPPPRRRGSTTLRDPYLDVVSEQWPYILRLYNTFAEKKPVMLFDIQEQRIYAYPYRDFQTELSPRSQMVLQNQYEVALAKHQMVVFVRDNEQKKLVSYSLSLESSFRL